MRFRRLLKALILPPASLLMLAVTGLVIAFTGPTKPGLVVATAAVGLLWLLALPTVARGLLGLLDRHPPLDPRSPVDADAIVVLDSGRRHGARERASDTALGGDDVHPRTAERVRHAAWLQRWLDLPIAVSGDGAGALMAEVLQNDHATTVRWIEPDSRTTRENAARSATLLKADGIGTVVLVTHFWHLPRAVACFRRAGLAVVPAPLGFSRPGRTEDGILALVPSPAALVDSRLALHELLGWVVYRVGEI